MLLTAIKCTNSAHPNIESKGNPISGVSGASRFSHFGRFAREHVIDMFAIIASSLIKKYIYHDIFHRNLYSFQLSMAHTQYITAMCTISCIVDNVLFAYINREFNEIHTYRLFPRKNIRSMQFFILLYLWKVYIFLLSVMSRLCIGCARQSK